MSSGQLGRAELESAETLRILPYMMIQRVDANKMRKLRDFIIIANREYFISTIKNIDKFNVKDMFTVGIEIGYIF